MENYFYFLHVPKCGGSTFVRLAENNATLFQPHINGNPVFPNQSLIKFWEWSSAVQGRFLKAGPHNFVANDTGIGAELPDDDLITLITILRDPLDRVLSGYQHRHWLGYSTEKTFAEHIKNSYAKERWRHNSFVKMLRGKKIEEPLVDSDVDLAITNLNRFDVVIDLDDYANSVEKMRAFGWTELDVNQHRTGTRQNSRVTQALSDDTATYEQLTSMEELDLALFEKARPAMCRK